MDVLVCMYAFCSTFLLFQCHFAATAAQSHSRLLRRNSRPSHGGIKARLMQLPKLTERTFLNLLNKDLVKSKYRLNNQFNGQLQDHPSQYLI